MTEKLSPCPFCNEPKRLEIKGDRAARWVHCYGCGADGPKGHIGSEDLLTRTAVVKWNAPVRRS